MMSYLAVIVIVGLVIVIHECGHLLAAKWCGIPIDRFSIGFGPKLLGFRRGETTYWLSMIPLGGYVLPAVDENAPRLSLYQSVLFAVGGPLANVISAFACLIALGSVRFDLSGMAAVSFATTRLGLDAQAMVQAVSGLFVSASELSGIIGIVAVGGSQFGASASGLLAFAVAINLNLAIFNLLPFPPLDGGRIVFALLERIYQPLSRVQAPVMLVGWAFMLALMAYATIQDLARLSLSVLS